MKNKKFIEILIEALDPENIIKNLNELNNNLADNFGPNNYCIGSGGSFKVYENIKYSEAKKIFDNLEVRQCFGTKIDEIKKGYIIVEKYYCMESNSGITYIFMFAIDSIIKKEKNNGNAIK